MTGQLALENVSVLIRDGDSERTILFPTTIAFERGIFTLLLGPSGSGKTTFLSVAGGLLAPTNGTVRLLHRSLYELGEIELSLLRLSSIGFVFQSSRLLRGLTVLENVSLPLRLRGIPRSEAETVARGTIDRLGLLQRQHSFPASLSGGEAQRVTLARAMVAEPEIILADEPTASIDHDSAELIAEWLLSAAVEKSAIVICATHDSRLMSRAQKVVRLNDGRIQGRM